MYYDFNVYLCRKGAAYDGCEQKQSNIISFVINTHQDYGGMQSKKKKNMHLYCTLSLKTTILVPIVRLPTP
jgi:hypothetical protein